MNRGSCRCGRRRVTTSAPAPGKQKWKTFKRKKDAERFLNGTAVEVEEGTYVSVKPLPMGELFDAWLSRSLEVRLKTGVLKPSTAKSYRSVVEVHLRPAFENYRSDHLSHEVVEAWAAQCADRIAEGAFSAKSYNNLMNLLGAILKWARGRGQRFLRHDPLAEVHRARVEREEAEHLEPDELARLLEAAQGTRDRTIIATAAYTGLRRGELFGLQWDDLDERDAVLRVRRSNYQGDLGRVKTRSSERTVDVPGRLVAILRGYRESYPELEGGGYVFRTETGSPLDPDNWYQRRFVPTVKRAELRSIGLHTLRHTYASLLIANGESIKYVSRQLGHASIQITADTYAHLLKETSTSAMGRLDMRISATTLAEHGAEEAVA